MRSTSLGGEKKRTANATAPKPFMGSEALAKRPSVPVVAGKSVKKEPEPASVPLHKKGTSRVAHVPRIVSILTLQVYHSIQLLKDMLC